MPKNSQPPAVLRKAQTERIPSFNSPVVFFISNVRVSYNAADQWKGFFFIEEITGIKGLTGTNANNITIKSSYDLNGKRLYQFQKGLNILKMSDGTTRKVVK